MHIEVIEPHRCQRVDQPTGRQPAGKPRGHHALGGVVLDPQRRGEIKGLKAMDSITIHHLA